MLAHFKRFGKRLILMTGSEAIQSAFHLGLNIALVHVSTARDYGIFAIVMLMGGLGLTYVRALFAMPVTVFIGHSRRDRAGQAYDVAFGSGALVLSVLIGVTVALLLQFWFQADAAAGGIFVFVWCLRSYMRTALFALGRPVLVAVSDVAFTASGTAMAAILLWLTDWDKLQGAFCVLAIANALGVIALLVIGRRPVRVSFRKSMRLRFAKLWRELGWSAISITTINLQGQGMAFLVAAIAGPAAYAPIAASFVFFAPLRLIGAALANMMQPLIASHLRLGEADSVRQLALAWTAIMGFSALAYGAALIAAFPLLSSRIFEDASFHVINLLAWAIVTASMLYVMPRIILEVIGAFRLITLISAGAAVIGMSIVVVLLRLATPAWSLIGAFASEFMVMACFWISVQLLLTKPGAALKYQQRRIFRRNEDHGSHLLDSPLPGGFPKSPNGASD